ncbi:hypothetical protein J4438_00210 [Candidatus Woesearchaeota archaeon]|nr:hypothetical protein [Candidatus Woesearchaeota archaeon]
MKLIIFVLMLVFIPSVFAYDDLTSYIKLGVPSSLTDGTELNSSQYVQINLSDDSKLVSHLTGANPYDSQIFLFNMSTEISNISLIDSINFTWEGYGENSSGYYTNISIWNWTGSSWYQINATDFTSLVDQSISISITSGLSDFINSTSEEVGFLVSSLKNYSCGSGNTDNGDGTCTATLRPDAAGDFTELTTQYPSSTSHYDKVDEVTADGDTTYVSSTADNVYSLIRENSVNSSELLATPVATYQTDTYFRSTRPSDNSAWTISDVDDLQIGVRLVGVATVNDVYNLSASNIPVGSTINNVTVYTRYLIRDLVADVIRVTQVYAVVEYTSPFVSNVLNTDYVNLTVQNQAVSSSIVSSGSSSSPDEITQRPSSNSLDFFVSLTGSGKTKEVLVEDKLDLRIKKIEISSKSTLRGTIEIFEKDEIPEICSGNNYILYKGYEILHDDILNKNIESVSLIVEIDDSWIDKNKIDRIIAFKCDEKKYSIDVKKLNNEEYVLESDGFSEWYVVGVPGEMMISEEDDVGKGVIRLSPDNQVMDEKPSNNYLILTGWVLVSLLVSFLFLKLGLNHKKRHKKK